MNDRTITIILLATGAVITLGAVAWWASVYGPLTEGPVSHAGDCLYTWTEACRGVGQVAYRTGHQPYTPIMFWGGIYLLLAGVMAAITRVLLSQLLTSPDPSPPQGGVTPPQA